MPELPEVETVRRGLARSIVGRTLAGFETDTKKMLNHPLPFYQKTLKGQKILAVRRRAKMIIIELSGGWSLLIHLKMTGQLVFQGKGKCVIGGHPIKEGFSCTQNKFTHAVFTFKDGTHLFFNDVRKFGWIRLYKGEELLKLLASSGLGTEPLEKEFTLDVMEREMARRGAARIKQFLLDQRNVAGIGNIYGDEISYYARVRPDRRVKTLSAKEKRLIYKGIKRILAEAIKYEGTSISDYVKADGEAGAYTKKLKVYQRCGKKCYHCRGVVARLKLGGRTSSYCPRCQK